MRPLFDSISIVDAVEAFCHLTLFQRKVIDYKRIVDILLFLLYNFKQFFYAKIFNCLRISISYV